MIEQRSPVATGDRTDRPRGDYRNDFDFSWSSGMTMAPRYADNAAARAVLPNLILTGLDDQTDEGEQTALAHHTDTGTGATLHRHGAVHDTSAGESSDEELEDEAEDDDDGERENEVDVDDEHAFEENETEAAVAVRVGTSATLSIDESDDSDDAEPGDAVVAAQAVVPAPPARPLTQEDLEDVNRMIVAFGNRFMQDVHVSNQRNLRDDAHRAINIWARIFTLGQIESGVSAHPRWQGLPARDAVINPGRIAGTDMVDVGPNQWRNVYNDVQDRQDSYGRRWANCAEQAGSFAHVIREMIINNSTDPRVAGLQVRQGYSGDVEHSFVEVRYPNGQIMVYDTWAQRTGRLEDMGPLYNSPNNRYTPWYGRRP